ncbi:hypothetical protein M2347_003326 [Chryseobacterium sp. H1D6B]|uniref:hypothetical protein n=1 Tax=Chryseobacterium sp. H1D6B TaxID=2940588 RepID=UPI0015CB7A23|nr:hypothetical protein [Chryseobacterium sp. H1D6B]MDH6253599.1 hypothetical protein [Chryseobacterium sp. H1D6B]
MIRRLQYHEIDFNKYTECLEGSEQKNWYAKKEVLDQLSGNWELVVYGDYEAVMPVPFKVKLGIKMVIIPLFCQQLGVFSKKDDLHINNQFLKFLKRKYIIFLYSFNQYNVLPDQVEKKKNYIIPISIYDQLRKKYFKGRKSTVKWSQHLFYREMLFDSECISFIQNNFKGLYKESDVIKLNNYLDFLNDKSSLKLCGVFLEDKLINLAVLISDTDQLSLLALINDEDFKNENGPSFLIDKILKNYIHEKSLNFMGSNIRGIEVFFKSFGAELFEYRSIEDHFVKILKKIM